VCFLLASCELARLAFGSELVARLLSFTRVLASCELATTGHQTETMQTMYVAFQYITLFLLSLFNYYRWFGLL